MGFTEDLRTFCNNHGFSCRDAKGNYLPNNVLLKLYYGVKSGTKTKFPNNPVPVLQASKRRNPDQYQDQEGYAIPLVNRKRLPSDPLPRLPAGAKPRNIYTTK